MLYSYVYITINTRTIRIANKATIVQTIFVPPDLATNSFVFFIKESVVS